MLSKYIKNNAYNSYAQFTFKWICDDSQEKCNLKFRNIDLYIVVLYKNFMFEFLIIKRTY
jgi:hypothetical protein